MKRAFPANINGYIFYIDEDAYNLLNVYLDDLRRTFTGSEGEEIVSDIESRISEIFNDRLESGAKVITITEVNNVIEQMGRPAELSDGPAEQPAETINVPPPYQKPKKKLYRDENNNVFGGVLAGLSHYTGWNVTMMRVLLVVIACATYLLPFVLTYMVAWMVIPPAKTPSQQLQMYGEQVTLDNIGRNILVPPAISTVQTVLSAIGKVIMGFIGLMAGTCSVAFLVLFFTALVGLVMYAGWGDLSLLTMVDIHNGVNPYFATTGMMCVSVALLIPSLALVWGGCMALFRAKGASRATVIVAIVLEAVFIALSIVLMAKSADSSMNLIGCAVATTGIAGLC